jgi:H+-transporting ATPase
MDSNNIKGLSASEVEKLQKKYGQNEIEEKSESSMGRLLKKFVGPIPLMIEAALILSLIIQKWEDFIIIAVLLVVNISVDYIQEQNAHKALQALKKTLAPTAVVLREGSLSVVDAKQLVPGDVIKLKIGDVVPADAVLIDDTYVNIDQSTITGESLPVEKKKGDTVFVSSIVQKGIAFARVSATGRNSSMGKNAELVAQAGREEESHFQIAIIKIGKFLMALSGVLIVILFYALISQGDELLESIRFVLVLAVASVPVALPAVLSVTMAIGASTLAKRNAIVSNFKAIEELAGVDELCIDKTGTLTKNAITVTSPKTYGDFSVSDLFAYALLASNLSYTSPIEKAIKLYTEEHSLEENLPQYKIKSFIPFDPTRKMTEAAVATKNEEFTIMMGAPQVIVSRLGKNENASSIEKDIDEFAKNGFRTLALAKKVGDNFLPVGVIPLLDPPRDDSASVISSIKNIGVDVKMLTGDNSAISLFIAKLLNIGKNIIDSSGLRKVQETEINDDDVEAVTNANIFAEVIPEDKYYIIDVLKKDGHIVAMTGDGVNDAPALKKADIGIAVSGASPAARSAADVVLLSDGLSVIKDAIVSARMTFTRMQSYATFRIAETIRIVFFITLSVLIFNYTPLTAVMIIVLALLNDIPVMAIAYDNAAASNKPIRWHMQETLFIATVLGIAGLASSFLLFYWLNVNGYAILIIQTLLFLKLDVSGHSTLYLTRTGREHFWKRPFPSLKFFIPAFGSRIIGTIIALFGIFMEPISWQAVVYLWIYATVWFLINDQIKVFSYKLFDLIKKHH